MTTVQFIAVLFLPMVLLQAALFAYHWRTARERWALLICVTFLMLTLPLARTVVISVPPVSLSAHTIVGNVAAMCLALCVATAGLSEWLELPRAAQRWSVAGMGALTTIATVVAMAGILTRRDGVCLLVLVLCVWAGLAAWRQARSPSTGAVLVLLLMLVSIFASMGVLAGRIPPELLNGSFPVVLSLLGMTMLVTNLSAARQRLSREVDARRQAEQELRALHGTLERQVADRTAALQTIVEGLKAFSRAVSHDLRNPLAGIKLAARVAQDSVAAGDATSAVEVMRGVHDEAESADRMVRSLLQFAEAGEAVLRRERIDTTAMLREVVDSLCAVMGANAAAISIAPLPELEGDPVLLRQAFANIVGNAIKYSRRSGQPRIEVGRFASEHGVGIFVRDNGPGFPATEGEKLFEPFFRLGPRDSESAGVGLSIVRRIVERHGGRVWAESQPGQGATFRMALPGAA
jgi:signal transduction histidine kinase